MILLKKDRLNPGWKSDLVNDTDQEQVSKDLLIIPNDCMRDNRSNHSKHEEATGVEQKRKGCVC